MCGVVGVLDLARKVGLDIMCMKPLTGLDIARHMADRKAVLDDVLPRGNRTHGHLMTLRNILRGHDLAHPGNRDGGALASGDSATITLSAGLIWIVFIANGPNPTG